MSQSKVGICDMALYVPKLYLKIEKLAQERNLEYAKLNKGLGLEQMLIPDVHEDAATMAANAVDELIVKNDLDPKDIGRIYLGTESALDGAKPTATYILEMLRRKYIGEYGADCFRNCDVVDLTFACVGAVDALQNTVDWARGDKKRIGIVVASDYAKYELNSGGEYTQGAGAIAMLVKHDPRLLVMDDAFGVATRGVHDFYKPRRSFSKATIVEEILKLAGAEHTDADEILSRLPDALDVNGFLDSNETSVQVFKETPVFDGQYSNWTYQNRIREAYLHYCEQKSGNNEQDDYLSSWERLIFHLPYAYHGKRIASELFMISLKQRGAWTDFKGQIDPEPRRGDFKDADTFEKARSGFLRSIAKTNEYAKFVNEKLEKAQRASSLTGNMYACSIFLALMSSLEADLEVGNDLKDASFGFFGYGSGSKSKVFEAQLQDGWQEVAEKFKVFKKLENGTEISYEQYEQLHRKQLNKSILKPADEFVIDKIGTDGTRLGARYYKWMD